MNDLDIAASLTKAIVTVRDHLVASGQFPDFAAINAGYCGDFADNVQSELERSGWNDADCLFSQLDIQMFLAIDPATGFAQEAGPFDRNLIATHWPNVIPPARPQLGSARRTVRRGRLPRRNPRLDRLRTKVFRCGNAGRSRQLLRPTLLPARHRRLARQPTPIERPKPMASRPLNRALFNVILAVQTMKDHLIRHQILLREIEPEDQPIDHWQQRCEAYYNGLPPAALLPAGLVKNNQDYEDVLNFKVTPEMRATHFDDLGKFQFPNL